MTPDFKSYLVAQIIAEKQTVSYRNVSRALKVHVNSAKCMLYEFWEKENKKRPDSIYATYIIAGTKRQDSDPIRTNGNASHTDNDVPMPSSPPPIASSLPDASQQTQQMEEREDIPVKTISLVRQEDLETLKAQYENITSIHIYSLSPGRLQDLVILTDIGRGLFANTSVKEDPLTNNKTYGAIQNPGVRRREGKRPTVPEVPASKPQPMKENKNTQNGAPKPAVIAASSKAEVKESSRPVSRDSSTSASSNKQPNLKRDGSNLFKAFAKAQNKPRLNREDTNASTNASASGAEDVKMTDADEGESEDDALFLDTGTTKTSSRKRQSEVKKEREDKRAKLRKMMDSDDEAEKALPNVEDATGIKAEPVTAQNGEDKVEAADDADADADANEEVAWSESDSEKQRQKAPKKDGSTNESGEQISTEPKRRRGKRKVTKKRTMKDEDGYLVTKEEDVWESFSEDEPQPTKENPKTAFSSMKSQPSSQKSSAGAKGGTQNKKGDIMSFFGKK